MITRARERAASFAQMLESAGADVVALPLIEIVDPSSWAAADQAFEQLASFQLVIFTSTNAVDQWMEHGKRLSKPPILPVNRVCAVGTSTGNRVRQYGFPVDLVPEEFNARGVLRLLDPDLRGIKILLPRGDLAREELPCELRMRGAEVFEAMVYRTQPAGENDPRWIERIQGREIDVITFASPSAVDQFVQWVGKSNLENVRGCFHAASIGPTTSAALRREGFETVLEASPSTLEGLTAAIVRFFEKP